MNNYSGLKCRKNPPLEFYVLNYDTNRKKVINYNIFNNIRVYNNAVELTRNHIKGKTTFDEFKEELLRKIQWQEWARREYEISVADAFETNCEKLEKWDCYSQAKPNIDVIALMCIDRTVIWPKGE